MSKRGRPRKYNEKLNAIIPRSEFEKQVRFGGTEASISDISAEEDYAGAIKALNHLRERASFLEELREKKMNASQGFDNSEDIVCDSWEYCIAPILIEFSYRSAEYHLVRIKREAIKGKGLFPDKTIRYDNGKKGIWDMKRINSDVTGVQRTNSEIAETPMHQAMTYLKNDKDALYCAIDNGYYIWIFTRNGLLHSIDSRNPSLKDATILYRLSRSYLN